MKIKSGASVFLVKDVQASAAYFRDAVGFRFDLYWGDPPEFCMVWRDEQCIMLSQANEPGIIRPVSSVVPAVWDVYFWVDDVDAFHADLSARGARIACAPFVKPYGVKEFVVVDLDGHQLAFGEELLDDGRSDGQVIGRSEMYASAAARDKGIASVKANAPSAAIDDNT